MIAFVRRQAAWLHAVGRWAVCRFRRPPRIRRLYLEVTHRCNLACPSCYTNAGREKPDALTFAEQMSVVRQARQMGARVVSISGGGEPLLYPRLTELIDAIRALDMGVVIFTNGTLCTAEMARFLMGRQVVVYFQLPSLRPDVTDRMTGTINAHTWVDHTHLHEGTPVTVRIPRGLKNLLDAQHAGAATPLVRLEALITRLNHTSLPEVAAFSRAESLPLHLETPVFTGRALTNHDLLALDGESYRTLHARLAAVLGAEYLEDHRLHACPVEKNPVVWTNGDVALCSSRRVRVGNVRHAPLGELFLDAQKRRRRQDRDVERLSEPGVFFHTCHAGRYYEQQHDLPREY